MKAFMKIWLLILLIALVSCDHTPETKKKVDNQQLKESLEKVNRYLVKDENEEIDHYVKRHGLEMTATGTGLRYVILKQGQGRKVEAGNTVTLEYELTSITGDLIYSSEKDGVKRFVVGGGPVESGLDEAVRYMHLGDVAKVIIPSHLAFGLPGDNNEITNRMTLVYLIKIVNIQ